MTDPHRKRLILLFKVILAIALLGWVLHGVNWYDYLILADSEVRVPVVGEVALADHDALQYTVPDGSRAQRPTSDFLAVGGAGQAKGAVGPEQYVRPGFLSSIRRVSVPWLAVSSLGFIASIAMIAIRWRGLLKVQGVTLSLWQSAKLTWLGSFMNFVVLGTTGGDLVKAFYVSRHGGSKTGALVSVLLDRAIGLAGLAGLAAVMLAVSLAGRVVAGRSAVPASMLATAAVVVVVALLALAGAGAFVFSGRLRSSLRLGWLVRRLPVAEQLSRARDTADLYRRHPRSLWWAGGLTLVGQAFLVLGVAALGRGLSLGAPWSQYALAVPLIYIIAAVPVVPGGVGLMESCYVAFFSSWANDSELLAMALFARLVPMFWSLPGLAAAGEAPRKPAEALEGPA